MLHIRLLLIALTVQGFGPVASAHTVVQGAIPGSAAVVVPDRAARAGTLSLIDARGRLDAAAPGERAQRLAELLAVAKRRHDDLANLVDANPAEFLRVSLPADLRAGMPPEAKPFVEQDADETGDLEVFHVDHADPADDFYLHFLNTAKGKFSLHFAGVTPDLVTGARVRVRGLKLDSAIVLAAGDVTVTTTTTVATLSNTLGAQKTLVMLVNFSDAPTSQPFTPATAANVVFTGTSAFDYATSYQQTWLTGDVAGWFSIAETSATCNYTTIASQAKQAAAAAGWVLSNYTRYVYAFPANACTWWGLGSVGGNPSQAWVNSKWGFSVPVVGHEMGHNFGLYHSHSMDCGSATIAGSGCTTSDYGDVFDIMGQATSSAQFNAFQKERLGWLNAGVSPPLTTVMSQPGTFQFSLGSYEGVRDGTPRALKIQNSSACSTTSQWYYVEARQSSSGVIVHQATVGSGNSSYLLDMTPATSSWSDAGLAAGRSFTDPVQGVTIAPVSVGSSGATVNVTFPAANCTHTAPAIALTPNGTVWTAAGLTTNYTATITNTDTCACAASAFDVGVTVPSGWAATSARTSSLAPGSSTSAQVSISVASSAAPAFYDVAVKAANATAPAVVASAAGTIAIANSLTVGVATNAATYTRPKGKNSTTYATLATTVTSGANPLSGVAVSVQVTNPGGTVTTLTAATGSNGVANVSYPIRSTSAVGTYGVTSTATMGTVSGSGTTAFIVR